MVGIRNSGVASDRLVGGRPRVVREITLAASPDRVWLALTRSTELSAWFGGEVQIDPAPRGRITIRWPDGWERGAVVEEVEPGRRLSFRWLPFRRTATGAPVPAPPGRIEFVLEPEAGGTRLTVAEWGPAGRFPDVGSIRGDLAELERSMGAP